MSGEPRSITERQSLEAAVDQRNETNRWSGRAGLLHFLRQNANYLIPGCGLNFWYLDLGCPARSEYGAFCLWRSAGIVLFVGIKASSFRPDKRAESTSLHHAGQIVLLLSQK